MSIYWVPAVLAALRKRGSMCAVPLCPLVLRE